MKTNEDTHILSVTQMFAMDHRFCCLYKNYAASGKNVAPRLHFHAKQCKIHADIRGNSVARGPQTTAGWSEPAIFRPNLSLMLTNEVFSMDFSLCRYTFYADNCGGSLERTRQTTVGAIFVDSRRSVAKLVC